MEIKKKLYIHIPLTPNEKTISQLAFYNYSLKAFKNSEFTPHLRIFLKCAIDHSVLTRWDKHLQGVEFIKPKEGENFSHLDSAFLDVPEDADLVAYSRPDGFFVSSPDQIANEVLSNDGVAGVIAFAPFPSKFSNPQKSWEKIFLDLGIPKPEFKYTYAYRPKVKIPFYLNMGLVLISGSKLRAVSTDFKLIISHLKEILKEPHYSYSVGLSALIARHKITTFELPLNFNFPNDDTALATRKYDLSNISFCHYLRNTHYDNSTIFIEQELYYDFLFTTYYRSDFIVQNAMESVSDGLYPFD